MERSSIHRWGPLLQEKVQSFQHYWHSLVRHHCGKFLLITNHMHIGHSWQNIFMHSYDLIKTMLNMRDTWWGERSGQPNFKMSTGSRSDFLLVTSTHSLLLNTLQVGHFPAMAKSLRCTAGTLHPTSGLDRMAECTLGAEASWCAPSGAKKRVQPVS